MAMMKMVEHALIHFVTQTIIAKSSFASKNLPKVMCRERRIKRKLNDKISQFSTINNLKILRQSI